jgi:hypothetical protein
MVKQGLKSLAETSANFSNQGVQNAIAEANIGFVTKTKTLATLADASEVLTETNKTDLNNSMEVQSYLNAGRYLVDLDDHTADMLQGLLGESNVDGEDTGTFLEQLGMVDGIQGSYLALYGEEASTANRGVDDHFGSLRGILNSDLSSIRQAVNAISSVTLDTDTAYQNAVQAIIDYINTLTDSTAFDESTFNSLLSALETEANNFDSVLQGAQYSAQRAKLVAARAAIKDQITLEATNLGSVRSYGVILTRYMAYQGLAENEAIREIISKTAQTTAWRDYYENYESRFDQLNAKYENTAGDSENSSIIDNEMRIRGLPDVTDYTNLQAVAAKASRDTRLITTVSFPGRSIAEVIKRSCEQLRINITGRDVYGQSQALLENMNNFDRDTIKLELENHQRANTLS